MSQAEYRAALLQAAQISELLCKFLDEPCQDLFEAYCKIYERIVKYEVSCHA